MRETFAKRVGIKIDSHTPASSDPSQVVVMDVEITEEAVQCFVVNRGKAVVQSNLGRVAAEGKKRRGKDERQ